MKQTQPTQQPRRAGKSVHRQRRTGRYSWRRLRPRSRLSDRRTPGTGKTTLALQFLLEGVSRGERCLYITLSESERELRTVAARHGWTLEGIDIFELVPPEASLDPDQELTLFHPAEVELSETTKHILDRVKEVNPSRVVFEFALRDAAARAKLPALSPPDPCLQEFLCRSAMHGRSARRSFIKRERSPAAQHFTRRHNSGAAFAGIRGRTPAPARRQRCAA